MKIKLYILFFAIIAPIASQAEDPMVYFFSRIIDDISSSFRSKDYYYDQINFQKSPAPNKIASRAKLDSKEPIDTNLRPAVNEVTLVKTNRSWKKTFQKLDDSRKKLLKNSAFGL